VQIVGPQSGVIGNTFAGALNSVEQGTDPDEAWESALKDIEAAAGEG
jgi:cellobiose transport system substrate-binding protein